MVLNFAHVVLYVLHVLLLISVVATILPNIFYNIYLWLIM
jgi:hypothetical protein